VSLSTPWVLGPGRFTRLLSAANTATCTQADNVKYHSRGERIAKEAANPWGNKDISAIAAALGPNRTQLARRCESAIGIWARQYGMGS